MCKIFQNCSLILSKIAFTYFTRLHKFLSVHKKTVILLNWRSFAKIIKTNLDLWLENFVRNLRLQEGSIRLAVWNSLIGNS